MRLKPYDIYENIRHFAEKFSKNEALNKAFESAKTSNTEEDNSHLIRIDNMFEEMRANIQAGGDADADNEENDGTENSTAAYYPKYNKKIKLDKK